MTVLDDVSRALDRPAVVVEAPGARRSSVAAVLSASRDLLLIRRAEREGDPWSGHMGLPGGHAEPSDHDAVATAIRETREELDLGLDRGQLLGRLDDVAPLSDHKPIVVQPFVFFVPEIDSLHPNVEVASVHRIALDALLQGAGRTSFLYPYRGQRVRLPCVEVDGQRLWGLTLRVVDDLLHRLDGRGIGLARGPGRSS